MSFADVEEARLSYRHKIQKSWRIATIIIAIFLLLFILPHLIHQEFSLSLLLPIFILPFSGYVVATIIITFTTRKYAEDYRKTYKAYFVETSLARTFTNLKYNHNIGLDPAILASTGMINLGDRYSSNDLVIANYKNVNFVQADAHIEEEHTDSDGDTTYVTIFRGRFMILEFPKKFNFRLEVIGRKFCAYKNSNQNSKTNHKLTKIHTESIDFNKSFRIYAEDGFEAYYILDPAFIEKIQAIGENYKYRLIFGFVDNTLLVGLNDGQDSFEPPKYKKPLDEKTELAKVSLDIRVITDLIDKLNLDKKLFQN